MTPRWSIVAFSLALSACHGIEHITPTAPTPRSTVPVRLTIVSNPGELPVGGGSALLIIEALGADGGGVSTPVSLEASGGELGADHVTTDTTGHANASWQGTASVTLTARAGEMITVAQLVVRAPVVFPPPSVPPPTPPPPPPDPPAPPSPPALIVTATASPLQIAAGSSTTLSTTVQNLNPGESVTAYQWDWDGNGTIDETTIDGSRAHVYTTDGIMAPVVRITTSTGRTTSATGRVIVAVAPAPPPPPPALPPLLVSLTPSSATPAAGASVTFTAVTTSTGTVPSGLTYEWDFQNDGVYDTVTSVNSTSTSFTAGSKTVKVRVTAPDGRTAINTTTVTVS